MSKLMLHDELARTALGRGVAKLARAVRGTLGPRGMNVFIDRPIGSPIVSRDGLSIADEIELDCPFENMGAQVVREVSRQTNLEAGDGTTTATVLADAFVQQGLASVAAGANPVELVQGLELAVAATIAELRRLARPIQADGAELRAVAKIAANDAVLGEMVAEAFERVGAHGIVDVQFGLGIESTLEVVEGMSFERGYLSHHMVTDVERMQVVFDNPYILMVDAKIVAPEELAPVYELIAESGRPLLIIADEISPACIAELLSKRQRERVQIAGIHPPEFGHWRKAMLEDIAVMTGGRVISGELGGRVDRCELVDLGGADKVRVSSNRTLISSGHGNRVAIAARRQQVRHLYDAAPENVERDKFQERLAKLSGGTALIRAGGATPVEQKRRIQLIEDSINAARAALEDGTVSGGGTAMVRVAPVLDHLIEGLDGSVRQGAEILRQSLATPFFTIAANCGLNGEREILRVSQAPQGFGLDARTGNLVDLYEAGIIDPVRASISAVRNAASVAGLILTTQTLIVKRPDNYDPTLGPARGGGAELLGLSS